MTFIQKYIIPDQEENVHILTLQAREGYPYILVTKFLIIKKKKKKKLYHREETRRKDQVSMSKYPFQAELT